jgi:hypothetical protein
MRSGLAFLLGLAGLALTNASSFQFLALDLHEHLRYQGRRRQSSIAWKADAKCRAPLEYLIFIYPVSLTMRSGLAFLLGLAGLALTNASSLDSNS